MNEIDLKQIESEFEYNENLNFEDKKTYSPFSSKNYPKSHENLIENMILEAEREPDQISLKLEENIWDLF